MKNKKKTFSQLGNVCGSLQEIILSQYAITVAVLNLGMW